jgi:hypothetical protein
MNNMASTPPVPADIAKEDKSISQRCAELYQLLYNNRAVLRDAPSLRLTPKHLENLSDSNVYRTLREDLRRMILYLLGNPRTEDLSIFKMLDILEKYYKPEDFWHAVILEYIEIEHEEEGLRLKKRRQELIDRTTDLLSQMQEKEEQKRKIIRSFIEKLAPLHLPVDAKQLITNYLNLAAVNQDKAWKILITNPLYFAPLQVTDKKGKLLITPKQAQTTNKTLAKFLKSVKI